MLAGGNRPLLIAAGAVVLLVALVVLLKPARPELRGKTTIDSQTFTLQPEKAQIVNFEVRGKGTAGFTLAVTAPDGDVLVGLGKRSPKDPQTNAALKKCLEFTKPVPSGQTETLEGEVAAGTWSWIFVNDSRKAVRVKVKAKVE
jgi:hypothetical protein